MKTLLVSSAGLTPEGVGFSLIVLQESFWSIKPDAIIFLYSATSDELAVRLSMRLGSPCITEVTGIEEAETELIATRSIYSGEISGRYLLEFPCCVSLRRGCDEKILVFDKEVVLENPRRSALWLDSYRESPDDSSSGISTAKAVVIAGKAIGSALGFEMAAELASRLGAQVGATRPVVMNGWAPMRCLVGVSGSILSAELCLILGASGSEAFTAGIENCAKIIAVNNDPNAAIFRVADIGIVGDCIEILKRLSSQTL